MVLAPRYIKLNDVSTPGILTQTCDLSKMVGRSDFGIKRARIRGVRLYTECFSPHVVNCHIDHTQAPDLTVQTDATISNRSLDSGVLRSHHLYCYINKDRTLLVYFREINSIFLI